ncbi:MAG: N-6 DNA methylase, partial [Candidatus Bathyarchaeia archaeon]
MSRLKVTKENPETIKKFTRDLKNSVRELSESLSELFELASTNTIKGPSSKVTLDLFDQWCLNSGILPIRIGDGHRTADELFVSSIYPIYQTRTDRGHIDPKRLTRLYSSLARDSGFDTEDVENFVNEAMSAALDKDIRTEERFQEHLYRYLYQLYHDEIRKFCVQTAHVILARIILYRVLEDKEWKGRNLVPRRISGVALEEIRKEASEVAIAALGRVPHIVYLKQVEDVRSFMETLIPRIYSLATYDWWVIPEGYKSDLKRKQDDILEEKEKFLDDCVKSALYYFDRYDFSQIDRDVWKDIYQEYLPYEERQRLGGFYTPDELVELILDLVGYDPNDRDLCERTLLDPACGSGTFLVEASLRLIKHLNEPLQCHTSLKDRSEGEAARSIIEKVRDKIFGIDIHPFAQFLTIVNLSFQIIDLFVIARRQFPNLKLEFNV